MLRLRTLGEPSIEDEGGDPLKSAVTRPKCFAVLAYLAARTDYCFHQRDSLLSVFWPESDQEHARNSLRQQLFVLRRLLGSGAILTRGRTLVGIDPTWVECDARTFVEAVRRGKLCPAMRLYRGPFLEGFFLVGATEFNRWADRTQVRLHRYALAVAQTLAQESTKRAAHAEAVEWWTKAESLAPYDTRVMRSLVASLMENGQKAEAYLRYRRFAARRASELRLPLDSDTTRAMEMMFGVHPTPPLLARPFSGRPRARATARS